MVLGIAHVLQSVSEVGNGTDLQGLEDDGLLENILMRSLTH